MARPPYRCGKIIGQRKPLEYMKRFIQGSAARGHGAHLLIIGEAGAGKSTIAAELAQRCGGAFIRHDARKQLTAPEFCGFIRSARAADVLFIDELHALEPAVQETLYGYFDRSELPRVTERGRIDATKMEAAPKVHFIGATNKPGRILLALRSRLHIVTLQPYRPDELRAIAEDYAEEAGVSLSPQAARIIVEHGQGNPRAVTHLVDDLVKLRAETRAFTQPEVERLIRDLGISRDGLRPVQQHYLRALGNSPGQCSTFERLVILTRVADPKFIRSDIEPFLLSIGAIDINRARQRVLTPRGAEMLKALSAEEEDDDA